MISLTSVAGNLLPWFWENKRDLPFRWQRDPYKILLAGVLLRQTQAAQVALVYPGLVAAYNTPYILSSANENDLKRILKPLGITSRARGLIDIAGVIVQKYAGLVPATYNELVELPGVGDYIASCVLALGYGQSMPMVDVNVARVISRLFGEDSNNHNKYNEICPKNQDEAFHYAILDLAQLICRNSNPKCDLCPLKSECKYLSSR